MTPPAIQLDSWIAGGIIFVLVLTEKLRERSLGVAQATPRHQVMLRVGVGNPMDSGITELVDRCVGTGQDDRRMGCDGELAPVVDVVVQQSDEVDQSRRRQRGLRLVDQTLLVLSPALRSAPSRVGSPLRSVAVPPCPQPVASLRSPVMRERPLMTASAHGRATIGLSVPVHAEIYQLRA